MPVCWDPQELEERKEKRMLTHIGRIYSSSAYSDLTLRCKGREFRVHKAVVCTRSKFFARATDGNFAEASSNEIALLGDPVDAVEAMVSYFYKLNYDERQGKVRRTEWPRSDDWVVARSEPSEPSESEEPTGWEAEGQGGEGDPVTRGQGDDTDETDEVTAGGEGNRVEPTIVVDDAVAASDGEDAISLDSYDERMGTADWIAASRHNISVYAIADKYDIPGLKDMALAKFRISIHGCESIPKHLSTLIRAVYSTTPDSDRGLRSIIVEHCHRHLKELMRSGLFQQTMQELGSFAVDLLRKSRKEDGKEQDRLALEELRLRDMVHQQECQIGRLTGDLNRATQNYRNAMRMIRQNPQCRHCKEVFRPYSEGGLTDARRGVVLRCLKCHTRHQLEHDGIRSKNIFYGS